MGKNRVQLSSWKELLQPVIFKANLSFLLMSTFQHSPFLSSDDLCFCKMTLSVTAAGHLQPCLTQVTPPAAKPTHAYGWTTQQRPVCDNEARAAGITP